MPPSPIPFLKTSYFCSNLTLLQRVEEGFPVSQLLLHPSKSFCGSQGMESDGRSLRLGPDSSGSQASFSAMAEEILSSEHAASSPCPDRTGAIFSQTRATCEPRQQPRSCSSQGDEVGEGVGGDGRRRWECLKGELEKARIAAKRRPLQQEVEECRKFITRSEKRISELDAERLSEVKALDEAKERLVRLEAEQAEVPKVVPSVQEAVLPVDCAADVQRLREKLTRVRGSCTILPKFLRGCHYAAGEGCKTSCRSCRVSAHQSTRCGTVVF